jgi:hypothetical protein
VAPPRCAANASIDPRIIIEDCRVHEHSEADVEGGTLGALTRQGAAHRISASARSAPSPYAMTGLRRRLHERGVKGGDPDHCATKSGRYVRVASSALHRAACPWTRPTPRSALYALLLPSLHLLSALRASEVLFRPHRTSRECLGHCVPTRRKRQGRCAVSEAEGGVYGVAAMTRERLSDKRAGRARLILGRFYPPPISITVYLCRRYCPTWGRR